MIWTVLYCLNSYFQGALSKCYRNVMTSPSDIILDHCLKSLAKIALSRDNAVRSLDVSTFKNKLPMLNVKTTFVVTEMAGDEGDIPEQGSGNSRLRSM